MVNQNLENRSSWKNEKWAREKVKLAIERSTIIFKHVVKDREKVGMILSKKSHLDHRKAPLIFEKCQLDQEKITDIKKLVWS